MADSPVVTYFLFYKICLFGIRDRLYYRLSNVQLMISQTMQKLTRRNFLRANGALLSLPFLHSFPVSRAVASAQKSAKPDKKMVIMYVPNGVVRRTFFPGEEEAELPGFIGGFNADKVKEKRRYKNLRSSVVLNTPDA